MSKISVIVPVYKTEQYLSRCIDSIVNQSYKNLEIILVDDGSPDNCGQICDAYASKDSRISVIHKKNGGLSSARNAGLDVASGPYIAFIDSDDYIDPDMYETLLRIANETDADIVECGYRWVKTQCTYDRENTKKIDTYSNIEAVEKLYFGDQMFGGISIVAWNKLYKHSLFDHIRYPQGLVFEDVATTPQLLMEATKIVKYNYNFYNFYFSDNSISRSSYSLRKIDRIATRKIAMDFFVNLELERYATYTQSLYINDLYFNWYECCKLRKNPLYKEKMFEIEHMIRAYYPEISRNPYVTSYWKHRLFKMSPFLWYIVAFAYKKAKYKLYQYYQKEVD